MLKSNINRVARTAAAATVAFGASLSAAYAEFPEQPVRMVVPLAAGGSHDMIARVISSNISDELGQPMYVDVVAGDEGLKGMLEVTDSPHDGYTLLFSHNYLDVLQQYVRDQPYEPLQDFIAIARVNYAPASIIVRTDSQFKSFDDLVAAARENPDSVTLGHSGEWGAHFVPAAQIMNQMDLEFDLVGFQGGGPAMVSLLDGELDATMSFPSGDAGPLSDGKIRVLATAGSKRLYDDVPTFEEVGIEGDVGFMHRVVLVPADVPAETIEKLRAVFEQLPEDKTFIKLMGTLNEEIDVMPGSAYQALREAQNDNYKALVENLSQ